LPIVTPTFNWQWEHLAYVRQYLDKVTSGEIKRLMLFLPPRHGKSEMCTVRYPVWRLEREPGLRVIVGAYNQILANKFSRKARRIAVERVPMSPDRVAVEDWETARGGGFRAVGVGGGITGQGGDLIVIDDPVKSREEANSEAYRERCWDWYKDDLYTRLEPGGSIILIMTRWHMDDLAGRILSSEDGPNWHVVTLPAEALENDPLGREIDEPLCPERYDKATLASIRMVLGTMDYTALYQQKPMLAEGAMFKRQWFTIQDAAPMVAERVRYWDKAGSEGKGDYSCGVLMARAFDGLYYIEDVQRGQWSSHQRNQIMLQTAQLDQRRYGDVGQVSTWMEQEPGSGGKESAEMSIRLLSGFVVGKEPVTGDKPTRARPFAAQCEPGNVKLIAGDWNASYLDELTAFPFGRNDDQVDASSGAFKHLPSAANDAAILAAFGMA
jgi:predicted phage terminase large subunit-like protein